MPLELAPHDQSAVRKRNIVSCEGSAQADVRHCDQAGNSEIQMGLDIFRDEGNVSGCKPRS